MNAIILAAGTGIRMVPIGMRLPKAFLEVNGELLIERIIRQLHEANIYEILIVVGFMKETFLYLEKKYNVKLIENEEYSTKNNLYSLSLACDYIGDSYIIPCDIWCRNNPFICNKNESWYMVSNIVCNDSDVRLNRKNELVRIRKNSGGNEMIGIAHLNESISEKLRNNIINIASNPKFYNSFWEETLYTNGKMIVCAKCVNAIDYIEINTYEQLRELDSHSNQLKSEEISIITNTLNTDSECIKDIKVLKKGMTNRSFSFSCNNNKYIMRIPGEGTEQLINRKEEANVYYAIRDKDICDDIVYINPENGYKITKFLKNARVCNPYDKKDLVKCMRLLKSFHNMNLTVDHEFDIYKQIQFYESLWLGKPSEYKDYERTKANVFSLREFIDRNISTKILTHIDAVPDNFLFFYDDKGIENIRLIDWEYAGMQDPNVDIAMFCIYSLYNKTQVDELIDIYFSGNCTKVTVAKIYCYIASCGLLWSNWCEYKKCLGVEFGDYAKKQYAYAKNYYKIAKKAIAGL